MTPSRVQNTVRNSLLAGLLLGLLLTSFLLIAPRLVYALPEYAERTNQPCATCHISPGGGGPRTMRGLLWIADGRPDEVRTFSNILLAPGVNDPQVLYEAACATCHGGRGEGASTGALLGFDLSGSLIRRRVFTGYPTFGMPSFEGQFTDDQLADLVQYVSDLSAGRILPPESYPLPPGEPACGSGDVPATCGGN